MASNVLPQALFMIPRNPAQCAPKKLGFSSSVSRHPSSLSSIRGSISSLSLGSSSAKSGNRSFVVRAEAEPESEAVATIDVAEEEEAEAVESGSEPEAEAEAKPPRKPRVKLGDIMGILNKRAIEASDEQRPIPDLRTGDIVEIKLEVPENRRRLSIYKGIVISRQNAGIHTTIRIRRIIAGIGVEIVFPIYSPNIKEIKLVKHRKVRRARLYYLRDKLPRLSTFK